MAEPRRFVPGERLVGPTPCARCGAPIINGERIQQAVLPDGSAYLAHRPACRVGEAWVVQIESLAAYREGRVA